VKVGAKVKIAVNAKAGIAVSIEARIAVTEEIRRTGLIVGVFGRFKVKVMFLSKS
jgi:hypothetical protein